jgi:ubiquinone/menaquinone biosynthesis C-methylase UbiE
LVIFWFLFVVCTQVALELSSKFNKKQASVLDLCCGVGFSTRALGAAFPDAEKIVGLDTSNEMLAMANFINAQINVLKPWYDTALNQGRKIQMGAQNICSAVFEKGNAEQTPFQDASFDLVTIMYVCCCCCYCR